MLHVLTVNLCENIVHSGLLFCFNLNMLCIDSDSEPFCVSAY